MRSRPTAYSDPLVQQLVQRLAASNRPTSQKVEYLARRVHSLTGWAGTPIPWEKWPEEAREAMRAHARDVLEEARKNA